MKNWKMAGYIGLLLLFKIFNFNRKKYFCQGQIFFFMKYDILLNLCNKTLWWRYLYFIYLSHKNKYKPILKLHNSKIQYTSKFNISIVIVNVRENKCLSLCVLRGRPHSSPPPPPHPKSCYVYGCIIHVSKYLIHVSIYVKMVNSL